MPNTIFQEETETSSSRDIISFKNNALLLPQSYQRIHSLVTTSSLLFTLTGTFTLLFEKIFLSVFTGLCGKYSYRSLLQTHDHSYLGLSFWYSTQT